LAVLRYYNAQVPDVSGKNVYGILRSGRSTSAEAIVLTAPVHPLNRHGLAVVLALAKYFNGKLIDHFSRY